jgi:hypothetical protein
MISLGFSFEGVSLMSQEKTSKNLKELIFGFTFKEFANIMFSSKIFFETYREHFPDANQHTLDQMYHNIKTIGAKEKTFNALEQLLQQNQKYPEVSNDSKHDLERKL